MNKYQKLIDLGLNPWSSNNRSEAVILAEEVLNLINSGVEVNTWGDKVIFYQREIVDLIDTDKYTHSGIVIGLKELKPKEVTITREELFKKLNGMPYGYSLDEIAKALGL